MAKKKKKGGKRMGKLRWEMYEELKLVGYGDLWQDVLLWMEFPMNIEIKAKGRLRTLAFKVEKQDEDKEKERKRRKEGMNEAHRIVHRCMLSVKEEHELYAYGEPLEEEDLMMMVQDMMERLTRVFGKEEVVVCMDICVDRVEGKVDREAFGGPRALTARAWVMQRERATEWEATAARKNKKAEEKRKAAAEATAATALGARKRVEERLQQQQQRQQTASAAAAAASPNSLHFVAVQNPHAPDKRLLPLLIVVLTEVVA